MTVAELIKELQKIEDKSMEVYVPDKHQLTPFFEVYVNKEEGHVEIE